MNINRHNYEEFFLLYVDNELSATERKAVDVFVQENPDLQIELTLLQDTVVKADDIVLDKKDWLYMEEDISALQENLLLYADGELSEADKKTVESVLATDKSAQKEWAVLQQIKLHPDMDVVFADKQSLYRKEPGRVVPVKWWRVAAAAVLLGIGIWTGVSVYKNAGTTKTDTEEVVNNNETTPGQIKNNAVTTNPALTNQPVEKAGAETITSTTAQKNNDGQSNENIKTAVEKNNDQNTVSSKENVTVQNNSNNKKQDNNLPKPALQNINNSGSNETTVQNVLSSNTNSNRVSGNNEAVVKLTPKENRTIVENVNNNKTDPNITAIAVVNTNKAAEGENNNRYLDVDDDKQKRSALGGFLRKAKRVLERNTNVKTGDGVKIAGFEIALK
jgi:hypothetical protein